MIPISVEAVHRCTEIDVYLAAKRGNTILFYSSHPMDIKKMTLHPQDVTSNNFAGEFYVYPNQAMDLFDLILKNTKPINIIRTLGLEKRTVYGVLYERQQRADRSLEIELQGQQRILENYKQLLLQQRHDTIDGQIPSVTPPCTPAKGRYNSSIKTPFPGLLKFFLDGD